MAPLYLVNKAITTLSVAVQPNDQTIQLVSGAPWAGATGPFTVVVEDEYIRCSGVNGNTLNVAAGGPGLGRGFDGSSPAAHALTDNLGNPTKVFGSLVRRDLQDAFARLDAAASQTLTGPLAVPPSIGGAVAPTSYGTLSVKIDEKSGALANYDFGPSLPGGVIPSGFRALRIRFKLRDLSAVAGQNRLRMTYNNDSTAGHYEGTESFLTAGTTLGGGDYLTAQTFFTASLLCGGGLADATIHTTGQIDIEGYADTNLEKTFECRCVSINGTNAAGSLFLYQSGGRWTNAISGITRITLTPSVAFNFDASSWCTLEGLP